MIGWLGNPAWWRETLPRLAHYYTLNVDREHSLPDIQIIYFGQIYEFSLPWHNAWVLMGITVPVAILVAGVIGLFWAIGQVRRDRLAVLLPDPLPDLAGDPDVPDAGARRSAALPADLLLPGGLRGLGDDLAGRCAGAAGFGFPLAGSAAWPWPAWCWAPRRLRWCGSILMSSRITTS